MRLYAELGSAIAVERSDEWADDRRLQAFSAYVEEEVVVHGRLDADAVAEHFELEDDPDARRYAYLRGIDGAMQLVHPHYELTDRGGMDALAVRFRSLNRFNTDDSAGALLPRFAFPDRFRAMEDDMAIEHKADLFEYVTVVSPTEWAHVISVRLPRHYSPPASVRLDGMVVGCSPICGGEDVTVSCQPGPPRRRYRVRLSGPGPAGRISAILEQLEARGAHIGMMPELTLDADQLAAWRHTLSTTPPPPGSRLCLILVGTGPLEEHPDGRSVNRAVVLHRSGRVLLEQDKRHPFTLTAEMVEEWGLANALGPGPAAEPLVPGRDVRVVEGPFGRMIILVCEDLGRTIEDGQLLLSLGPSLCLVPVLSKPTLSHYWEHSRAKQLSAEIGSNTVVANSLVIEHLQRAAGINPEGTGTALAHAPSNFAAAHVDDPAAVVCLRLHPDGAYLLT